MKPIHKTLLVGVVVLTVLGVKLLSLRPTLSQSTQNSATLVPAQNEEGQSSTQTGESETTASSNEGSQEKEKEGEEAVEGITDLEEVDYGNFGPMTSTTLEGEPISSAVFQDYDLTMVNIWATWCGPCVNEMGDLAELYRELPENWNLITVCSDASTNGDLAREILAHHGAEFQTVVDNDVVLQTIVARCTGFPTTVFVDRQGNIVGGAMVGAPPSQVVETYLEHFRSRA